MMNSNNKDKISAGGSKDTKDKPHACFIYYQIFHYSAMLCREAKAVIEKGYKVDIICLRENASEEVFESFQGMNLYKIQARPEREGSTLKYFLRLGLYIFKTFFLVSWLGLWRRYKFIHVTSPPDILVFTAIIPKLMGTKLILDIHDSGPELYMRNLKVSEAHWVIRILKMLERISSRFVDHVVTVTDIWKEKLTQRSCPEFKCSVLLNVPDEDVFRLNGVQKHKSSERLNLFFHGSLEIPWGVDTLVHAIPDIAESIPNVLLHIYGRGRLREQIEKLQVSLGIQNYLSIHGFVPFHQLPSILSQADIGIVPTIDGVFTDEALSMKSLEYIALGIPIVISRNRCHSYYYNDSMVKFFEPRNSSDLAEKTIELAQDEKMKQQQIKNSLEFLKIHGWKETKKKYYRIIDNLVAP